MISDSSNYASFRQRLDAALRTRDVGKVRALLIEEEQWTQDQPADPEYAMWLMIAGTLTLNDLHSEARQWLMQHGHTEAVDALFSRQQARSQGSRGAGAQKKTGAHSQKEHSKNQQPRNARQSHRNERQA